MLPNQNYEQVKPNLQANQIPFSNDNSYQSNNYPQTYNNQPNYNMNNPSQPYQQQPYSNQPYNQPAYGQPYPQQPGGYANQYAIGQPVQLPPQPQQMVPTIGQIFIPKSGFEKLMVPGIFVKQKFELLEVLTGCETENKYTVYACDVAGNKEGIPLFKCKERSGCCNRNCLPGDCRRFKMEVTHDSGGRLPFDGLPFLTMERPFECTCLCLNRPFIEVNFTENGQNHYVGKVVHEFNCCEMYFSLFDKTNTVVYEIRGSIWQTGVFNRSQKNNNCAFCKSCQQAFLFIHDLRQAGKKVGIIEKRGRGFSELISDADNFSLLFPIKATAEERVLLLACCLLLDFRYFETMGGGNNNNNRYYD